MVGIRIQGGINNKILNSHVSGCDLGIVIEGSENSTVDGSTVTNCNEGILVVSAIGTEINNTEVINSINSEELKSKKNRKFVIANFRALPIKLFNALWA